MEIKTITNLKELYAYQKKFVSPYSFETEYGTWKLSLLNDTDGAGRTLFRELFLKGVYIENQLAGFIQYGKTCFGIATNGDISNDVSHSVIRSFYYDENNETAGSLLLQEALNYFGNGKLYAFFHYFGMSCYARHGKLFEQFGYIEKLLKKHGFVTEHENVYYSALLTECQAGDVHLVWQEQTAGKQRYCDFTRNGNIIGGCEVHFPGQKETAYLRWIFVADGMQNRGTGSQCMNALKYDLYQKGIRRFDTDTASTNLRAQHYYEKNGFTREGITRSFIRE